MEDFLDDSADWLEDSEKEDSLLLSSLIFRVVCKVCVLCVGERMRKNEKKFMKILV